MRTVTDRHGLAAYHNKHCWHPFPEYRYQHRWPWTSLKNGKIAGFQWIFRDFRLRSTFNEWIFAEVTRDRPRQFAYEIKLILSHVWWALAQISCILPNGMHCIGQTIIAGVITNTTFMISLCLSSVWQCHRVYLNFTKKILSKYLHILSYVVIERLC